MVIDKTWWGAGKKILLFGCCLAIYKETFNETVTAEHHSLFGDLLEQKSQDSAIAPHESSSENRN